MHYKVDDPYLSDKKDYDTFFSSYTKYERYFLYFNIRNKVIMGSIASDLLDYLLENIDKIDKPCKLPHMEVLIPLLSDTHLIRFWKFFSLLDAPKGDFLRSKL